MSTEVAGRWGVRSILLGSVLVASACTKEEPKSDPTPVCDDPPDSLPSDLACTGLYESFQTQTIAKTARPYAPAAALWSDGYDKSRYIELPEGATIDTTNADDWTFPIGTKVWKEFRFKERKIETRLLWKTTDKKWSQASYLWSEDGKSATRGEGQTVTVAGDSYRVPSLEECYDCHRGKRDYLLGVEAISLAQPGAQGITLAALAAEKRLSAPPAKTEATIDPGLAVLHVNCGVSCHNATAGSKGSASTIRFRIGFEEATAKPVDTWELYKTTVGVVTDIPGYNGALRVAPGDPDKSAVLTAMKAEDTTGKMPPTRRQVDFTGVGAVEAWIKALPPK